jgi:hypothetical protein
MMRKFALIFGGMFLLVGILGFVPQLVTPMGEMNHSGAPEFLREHGMLLGLFPVNVLHNAVHIIIGMLGLVSATEPHTVKSYAKGVAVFYGLLAVMGFFPNFNTMFGIVPLWGHVIWLHAATAAVAAYFGWAAVPTASDYDREEARAVARTRAGEM